jgi:hypothetical protein
MYKTMVAKSIANSTVKSNAEPLLALSGDLVVDIVMFLGKKW